MARGELLADGVYQIAQAGNDAGRETWQLSRLAHGGVIVSTRLDRVRPEVASWMVSFELSSKWTPRGLTLRLDQDGKVMRTEQRADKSHWQAQVHSPAGTQEFSLPFSTRSEIGFSSPLFVSVTLVRAALSTGATLEYDLLWIQPGSLAPTPEHAFLTSVAEEKIQVPAGSFTAFKYELKQPALGGDAPLVVWADVHGIVLRQTGPNGHETQLARYRWMARR